MPPQPVLQRRHYVFALPVLCSVPFSVRPSRAKYISFASQEYSNISIQFDKKTRILLPRTD